MTERGWISDLPSSNLLCYHSEIPIGQKSEGPLGPFVQKSKGPFEIFKGPQENMHAHTKTQYLRTDKHTHTLMTHLASLQNKRTQNVLSGNTFHYVKMLQNDFFIVGLGNG